jgi:RNA polymerase-binding transcription factor DksA
MNISNYKTLLNKEQEKLTEAMSMIGIMNTDIAGDWVVHTEASDEREPGLLADIEEEKQTNSGILDTLEERMQEVQLALARIENGNFGVCMICGNKIEEKRLEANPAATTCLSCNMKEENHKN